MNQLQELHELGQSVWLDYISRDLLRTGGLRRLAEDDGISGVTSNPTIFESAICDGHAYDEEMHILIEKGLDEQDIFRVLAADDIRDAADLLRPVHEAAAGDDGYVSIEVSPELAHNYELSVQRARLLFSMVNRPNSMVKIPGTREGLKAIEQLIAEGHNINVTLLFSRERYREVIDAYLRGLERLDRAGGDLSKVFSVASFFVSRVDTLVDRKLDELIASSKDKDTRVRAERLKGKIAVANAKVAYEIFHEAFRTRRFSVLAAKGARRQKLLWASTSTKNPAYGDILYVEELIGPATVNTMTHGTIEAYRDHGRPHVRLTESLDEAKEQLRELESLGIPMREVTDTLEREGVEAFVKSYHGLIRHIKEKADKVAAA